MSEYHSLFKAGPAYFQLAKYCHKKTFGHAYPRASANSKASANPKATAKTKATAETGSGQSTVPEDESLLFYSIILLGQCMQAGHSAVDLSHFANKPALQALAVSYVFPKLEIWQEKLQSFALVLSLETTSSLEQSLKVIQATSAVMVLQDAVLYLSKYAYIEYALAARLMAFAQRRCEAQLTESISHVNPADAGLIDWQKIAIANSLMNQLSFIVGGPGTGKTTTVSQLVVALSDQYFKQGTPLQLAFAAPTGKAAARLHSALLTNIHTRLEGCSRSLNAFIEQALPDKALTLHRLLAWHEATQQFQFHHANKLPYNCIIIDEVSMIDVSMFYKLMRAVDDQCRVILLGDPQQLASVQSGSVLSDLCQPLCLDYFSESRAKQLGLAPAFAAAPHKDAAFIDNISVLRKSYRFDPNQGVGLLAASSLQGNVDAVLAMYLRQPSDQLADQAGQFFYKADFYQQQEFLSLAIDHAKTLREQHSVLDAFTKLPDFQLLAVSRSGENSLQSIQQDILSGLNIASSDIAYVNEQAIYHGMPVIIERNLYQQGLFNGDIGIAWQDTHPKTGQQQLRFYFQRDSVEPGADLVSFQPAEIQGWQAAHVITVHKSQGSEYQEVALWLAEAESPLLNRELFYTAVTRAKQRFYCLADQAALMQCIMQKTQRFSNLPTLIEQAV